MTKFFMCLIATIISAASVPALALTDSDRMINIPKDSKFEALTDLAILANEYQHGFGVTKSQTSCSFSFIASPVERLLTTGTIFVVENVSFGYGNSVQIEFQTMRGTVLSCKKWSKDFGNEIPTVEDMKVVIGSLFSFTPSAPATFP